MEVHRMTNVQLERHIRKTALDSSAVFMTDHAKTRMEHRNVVQSQVLDCLQHGAITRPPEDGKTSNERVCRMEHFCAGIDLAVCVAVDGDDPTLLVVTVIVE